MPDDATIQRSDAARVNQSELVEIRLVKFYFIAALGFLCMALLGGMLVDLQLVGWNPLGRLELFSPGRWQMMQTDALAYGFLTNALFGCLHWMVPRNTLRPFASRELSYFVFILWQAIMLATFVGILAGEAQGVGWGETPVFVDPWAIDRFAVDVAEFRGADPQRQRSTARAALVFPGGSRVDAADLRDGKLRAAVFCLGHGGGHRAGVIHARFARIVLRGTRLGNDLFFLCRSSPARRFGAADYRESVSGDWHFFAP